MISVVTFLFAVASARANPSALARFFDFQTSGCAESLAETRSTLVERHVPSTRLTLRPARATDRPSAIAMLDDEDVKRWYLCDARSDAADLDRYFAKLLDGVRTSFRFGGSTERSLRLVIEHRDQAGDEPRVIGAVLIGRVETSRRWQIGYALAPDARGRGLGLEIVRTLLTMIGEIDPKAVVEAFPQERNVRSWGLLERAGFVRRASEGPETHYRIELNSSP